MEPGPSLLCYSTKISPRSKGFFILPTWIIPTKENASRKKTVRERETARKGFSCFYRISFHNGFGNQGLDKSWHLGFFGDHTRIESTGFSRGLLSGDRRWKGKVGRGPSLAGSGMQAWGGTAERPRAGDSSGAPSQPLPCVALSLWAGHLAFLSLGLPVGGVRSPLSQRFSEDYMRRHPGSLSHTTWHTGSAQGVFPPCQRAYT